MEWMKVVFHSTVINNPNFILLIIVSINANNPYVAMHLAKKNRKAKSPFPSLMTSEIQSIHLQRFE